MLTPVLVASLALWPECATHASLSCRPQPRSSSNGGHEASQTAQQRLAPLRQSAATAAVYRGRRHSSGSAAASCFWRISTAVAPRRSWPARAQQAGCRGLPQQSARLPVAAPHSRRQRRCAVQDLLKQVHSSIIDVYSIVELTWTFTLPALGNAWADPHSILCD